MKLDIQEWLKLLASQDPTPAGGALALATLAASASLASKCARLSGQPHQTLDSYAVDFHSFASQDCDAYTALVSGDAARADKAHEVSLFHLQRGLDFLEEACELKPGCKPVLAPDLDAACSLAAVSVRVLFGNMEVNIALLARRGVLVGSEPAELKEQHERLSRLGV